MTWGKFGSEFIHECAEAGLSDGAFRLHTEAILWLYHIEHDDCRILKHMVRRFAGGIDPDLAAKELARTRWGDGRTFWRDDGDAWVVQHHSSTIRQGLAAQWSKRKRDTKAQSDKRQRERDAVSGAESVTDTVTDAVSESAPPQSVSQTTRHQGEADSDVWGWGED